MNLRPQYRALAGDLLGVSVLFAAAWWALFGPERQGTSRSAAYVGLVIGEMLLPVAIVLAAGAAAARGLRAPLAAALAVIFGVLLFAGGAAAFGLWLPDRSPAFFQTAVPAMALLVGVLWLAERESFTHRTHGLLALMVASICLSLPLLLDRHLATLTDFAASYERRDLAFRLALPWATADYVGFDVLRAPRFYSVYRLGEGAFSYPTAREAGGSLLVLAGAVFLLFYVFPLLLRRPWRAEAPGF